MAGTLGTISGQVRLDIRQAVASYAALRAQNAKTVYALRGAGDSFVRSGKTMAVAGAGILYMFGKMVTAAGDFERKMDFFGAVTNATGKEMRQLTKYTLDLAKGTIFSTGEIADGFIELGKAGVNAKQIMDGIGKSMTDLAAAADIPLADAGQIITSTLQTFDLGAKDAVKVVNLLQGAANASIADVSDLGVSLKYVGGVAAATGVSFDSVLTAISLLAKAGIRGSTAGTSLRQMLVSLGGATGPATEELQKLGIIQKDGTNLFFTQAGAAKDLATVFQILQNHTKDLTQKQRLAAFRTIFNNRALAAASILTRDGAKGFAQMNKAMKGTTAAEVARKRLNNLSGDIQKLKNNLAAVTVGAGSQFQKQARAWVQSLTRLVQAFGKLDPHTQKMIIQTVAMTGAILLAMGTINLIIGTILKFIANMLTLRVGIKFVVNILKILIFNLRFAAAVILPELAAALGITVGALAAIVAAVIAVIAIFVILYKKWAPFRNLVNGIASAVWTAIKAFGAFVAFLVKNPGKAWDALKKGTKAGLDAVVNFFKSLPSRIESFLNSVVDGIGNFVDAAINWFLQLNLKIVKSVSNLVSTVVSYLTFRNLGYVIGYALGSAVRLFIEFELKMISLALKLVTTLPKLFAQLAPKIGYAIGFLIGRAIRLWFQFMSTTLQIIGRLINRVANFFKSLPGKVIKFVARMAVGAARQFARIAKAAPGFIANLVRGVVHWFSTLPERTVGFISRMSVRAIAIFKHMEDRAKWFAAGMFQGVINGIQGMPQAVWGILNDVISTIKSVIKAGFDAVKDFAGGLWSGFKSGLGIHSPSYIERAMWQITGVLDTETKKLAKHTAHIQKMSRQINGTSFTLSGSFDPDTAKRYQALLTMRHQARDRARTLTGSPGRRSAGRAARAGRSAGTRRREFVITNWHRGEGYFREIAQDVVDDDDSFDATVGGMNYS